jgi:hypothetical protein
MWHLNGYACLYSPRYLLRYGVVADLEAAGQIKDNISAFGGDSESLTGIGESAGAGALLLV